MHAYIYMHACELCMQSAEGIEGEGVLMSFCFRNNQVASRRQLDTHAIILFLLFFLTGGGAYIF